jgi:hypothetical protein
MDAMRQFFLARTPSLSLIPMTVAAGLLLASPALAASDDTGHAYGSRFPAAEATTVATTSDDGSHAFGSRFPVATADTVEGMGEADGGYAGQ